jgi:hypothetical protein
MSYLVREIEAYQRRIRGFERLIVVMAIEQDRLHAELHETNMLLASATAARDEAQDLLADLRREKVPTLESVSA